ncbi:flagellar biosynthetic protein FliQ [Escherichia coli]|nr:flagellar biosynthetic protein FliQ [Escherichia coli]WHG95088.1 flagellar biosynthetic protein FliQ [Escherichia coli]
MDDIVFAGNRALYLILVMSAGPIAVATFVGLLVGLFQTVTQLQETDVAIWREIIMRKYLLFFNERMVWRKIIFFWY